MLERLNVPPATDALPLTTTCPTCRQPQLTCYEDALTEGQWFYCPVCKRGGDPIQLAAETWGVTIEAAIIKLRHSGLPLVDDPYLLRNYVASITYRREAVKFWQDASKRSVHRNTAISQLVHELGWAATLSEAQIKTGLRRLYGWAPRLEIEQLFHPNAAGKRLKEVNSADRVFVGRQWGEDMIVVPYWHLPNYLAGFLFIGRGGQLPADAVYRRLNLINTVGLAKLEAGVTLHPDALKANKHWGTDMLAVPNFRDSVSLQLRNLERRAGVLPIVAWHASEDRNARRPVETSLETWQWFYKHQLTFWMPSFSPAVISQAARTGGRVAAAGPREEGDQAMRSYLQRSLAGDICRRLFRIGRPWHEVFQTSFSEASNADATSLLLRLEDDGLNLTEILAACPLELRRRADELLPGTHSLRTIFHHGDEISEEDCAWRRRRGAAKIRKENRRRMQYELICDALLRINEIVKYPTIQQVYYHGEIIYKNRSLPFFESQRVVETNTLRWMRSKLLDADIGVMQYDPTYSELVPLATRFRQPVLRQGIDHVGWQESLGELTFPQFSIRNGGDVIRHPATPPALTLPGRDIPPPEVCASADLEDLTSDRNGRGTLWAAVAAVLANMLSELFRERRPGIALGGAGACKTGLDVAVAMGLPRVPIVSKQRLRPCSEALAAQNWPSYLDLSTMMLPTTIIQWLQQGPHNCLARLSDWNCLASQAVGGWLVVHSERAWEGDELTIETLRRVISDYLQDLFSRRLDLRSPPNLSLAGQLLHDLSHYAESRYADGAPLLEGLKHLGGDDPQDRAKAFAEIIRRGMTAGQLQLTRTKFDTLEKPQYRIDYLSRIYHDDRGVYVPRDAVSKLLHEHRAMPLDALQIKRTLIQAQALVREQTDGWLLSLDWWQRHFDQQANNSSARPVALTLPASPDPASGS